jgi:hypothetical protein
MASYSLKLTVKFRWPTMYDKLQPQAYGEVQVADDEV